MASANIELDRFNNLSRYNALMDVVRNRMTNREFVANYKVPKEHFEMILEAAPQPLGRQRAALTTSRSTIPIPAKS